MVHKFSLTSVAIGLMAASLFAQGPEMRRGGGPGDFALLHAEFGISNKVVQGAPYSATAVTQFTQTLSTGDHIQRSTTASIARDSQGRTRTDRSLASVGALLAAGGGHDRAIIIHDPVAGMSYALDPASRTARSTPIPAARTGSAEGRVYAGPARGLASAKTEDLGTQTIQGVSAQGKRVTRAIPAGREGNEKEIDIVTETWYSPDLQMVVQSKTSDPRVGESVYQLTGITRTEPDPALFTVPSDYTVKEGRPFHQGDARRGPPPAQ
jgi:hypothetical protein